MAGTSEQALTGWRDLEADVPPCQKGFIRVRTVTTYRWHPYRPDGARQMKKPGRWQVIGGYGGWDNAELPEGGEWMPYEPGRHAPSESGLSGPQGSEANTSEGNAPRDEQSLSNRLANAIRGLISVRPRDWNDSEDPELEAAWREVEDALAKAGLHGAAGIAPGAPLK